MGKFFVFRVIFSIATITLSTHAFAANLSVDVPCSDENKADDPNAPSDLKGKPEFGQRGCNGKTQATGVKFLIKDHLKKMMGHIFKHYYDGYLVNFTDTNDPKNADKGFCKIKTVSQPVCEIKNNEIDKNGYITGDAGKCGYKPTGFQNLNNIDIEGCFKSIPTSDPVCGPALFGFVEAEMAEVKVKRDQYEQLKNQPAPIGPQAQAMFQKYDEILTVPQKKLNHLLPIWAIMSVQDNSEFCMFRRNGMEEQTCGKEMAWIRGFRVSLWKQNLQKVEDEIDSGKLTVKDYGNGAIPCKSMATAIEKILDSSNPQKPGIRQVENSIREKWGPVSGDLATATDESSLGLEGEEFAGAQDSLSKTEQAINGNYENSSQVSFIKYDKKHMATSVMSLSMARRRVESLFTKLAQCEVMERTKKDLTTLMQAGSGGIFGRLTAEVVKPCSSYAKNNASSESDAWTKFYQCYRNGSNGQGNVTQFFKKISQDNFDYDPARVPEVKALKMTDRAVATDKGFKVIQGGQDVPLSSVPYCKDLSGFNPAINSIELLVAIREVARRRKKKYLALKKALKLAVTLFIFVFGFLFSACDDDQNQGSTGPKPLICEDGSVAEDSNGSPVTYTGGMDGSDYSNKVSANCIDNPLLEPPSSGLADEYSAQEHVAEAQALIGDDNSGSIAKRSKEKNGNTSESSATEGGELGYSKSDGSKSGQDLNFKSATGRGLAGSGENGGMGSGNKKDGSSGLFGAGFNSLLGALSLNSDEDQNMAANESEEAKKRKSNAENFQGTTGSNSSAGGSRIGALDSSGGGGAGDLLIDGVSTSRSLTLFEIVNRRYDSWNRTNLSE